MTMYSTVTGMLPEESAKEKFRQVNAMMQKAKVRRTPVKGKYHSKGLESREKGCESKGKVQVTI